MQYAILIYEPQDDWPAAGERQDGAQLGAAYLAYTEELLAAKVMRGGEALAHPHHATTLVANAGGAPTVHDGPFADTKELFGGFYIIECETLDEALRWAKRCPAARYGKVEVRPIVAPPRAASPAHSA
ncbi:MAG: YciI family protein [Myxococcota bacterium]